VDPGELELISLVGEVFFATSGGNRWLLGILIFFSGGTSFGETEDFRSEKTAFLTIFGKPIFWCGTIVISRSWEIMSEVFTPSSPINCDLLGTHRHSISKNIARMCQVGKP